MHANACILPRMNGQLLTEIERFLAEAGISEHRFGILAAHNGRLVERLRGGGRVWPETEERVRAFMAERRRREDKAA